MTALVPRDSFAFSHHAILRIAQRGVRAGAMDLLLLHGTGARAGGDCEAYRLRDSTVRHLRQEGADPEVVEAARRLVVIVDGRGVVVTCYHARSATRPLPRRARSPSARWDVLLREADHGHAR